MLDGEYPDRRADSAVMDALGSESGNLKMEDGEARLQSCAGVYI
jgi:hypothetical protein